MNRLLRLARSGDLRFAGLMGACVALADSGRLATQLAQVIKLRPSDSATLHHVNVVHNGGVQREDSFNADTKTGLANRDGLASSTVLACNADSSKACSRSLVSDSLIRTWTRTVSPG